MIFTSRLLCLHSLCLGYYVTVAALIESDVETDSVGERFILC